MCNKARLVELVKSCGVEGNVFLCRQARNEVLSSEFAADRFFSNLMIEMFGKCGSTQEALDVFNTIAQPNIYSWNILIAAYARNRHSTETRALFDKSPTRNIVSWSLLVQLYASGGEIQQALGLFERMPEWNIIVWTSILQGCARAGLFREAERVFAAVPHSERDFITETAMFKALAEQGYVNKARELFDSMLRRDVTSWNSMIHAYARNGQMLQAQELFNRMQGRNHYTWSTMLGGFVQKSIDLSTACVFFERMPFLDSTACNTMLTAYAELGRVLQAEEIFDRMRSRDEISWNSFISATVKCREADRARALLLLMPLLSLLSWNSVLAGLAFSGRCSEALELFYQMPMKDVTSWSIILQGLSNSSSYTKAVELFQSMEQEGVQSDEICFLVVLSACAHAGLIRECLSYFTSAEERGLRHTPEHFGCLIDVLGRMGHLEEAEELLAVMPFVPGDIEWTALLSACRVQGDVGRSSRCAGFVSGLEPKDSTPYVLLSNAVRNMIR